MFRSIIETQHFSPRTTSSNPTPWVIPCLHGLFLACLSNSSWPPRPCLTGSPGTHQTIPDLTKTEERWSHLLACGLWKRLLQPWLELAWIRDTLGTFGILARRNGTRSCYKERLPSRNIPVLMCKTHWYSNLTWPFFASLPCYTTYNHNRLPLCISKLHFYTAI